MMTIGDHCDAYHNHHPRLYHFGVGSTEALDWVVTGLAKTSLITSHHQHCIHLHHGDDDVDDNNDNDEYDDDKEDSLIQITSHHQHCSHLHHDDDGDYDGYDDDYDDDGDDDRNDDRDSECPSIPNASID